MIHIVSYSSENYLVVFGVFVFLKNGLYSLQIMFSTQNNNREHKNGRRNTPIIRKFRVWIADWKHFEEKVVDRLRLSRSSRLAKKTLNNKIIHTSAAAIASLICVSIISVQTVSTYSLFTSKASTSMTLSAAPVFCAPEYSSTVMTSVYDATYGAEPIKACSSVDISTITMNVYGSSNSTPSPLATTGTEEKAVIDHVYGVKE
jgi:hypothetical protein